MVVSMLKSSWGSPLHLIIITDQESRAQVLETREGGEVVGEKP